MRTFELHLLFARIVLRKTQQGKTGGQLHVVNVFLKCPAQKSLGYLCQFSNI